jgi:1-acyl-sn-glycerol-3-phosphate acyltransferase
MCFFARKTLWKGGLSSWWLDAVGTIPVDRDGGQDVSALKRVLRSLAEGKVMILFPEGTRSPDGRLQAPKPGVGFILCKTQVPVVPARIFGSFEAFGRGTKHPRLGTPVDVVFGPPLTPAVYDVGTGKERYQAASEQVMAAIARLGAPVTAVV